MVSENAYYKAKIQVEFEDAKGRVKKRSEEYIVQGVNPTDVEVKITEHMRGSTEDFEIASIVLTKIVDILK